MPDHLAHYLFARRVLAEASEGLRKRICVDSAAFRSGTFGPDPLFNDPSSRRRAEGFEMHRRSGREALERMRAPVREKMPWAAEYAAGFFCHYALDRLCHPDIKAMAAQGIARHVAIESAYDRELRLRGKIRLPRRISLSSSALRAAAEMYRHTGPRMLGADVEAFWQIRRFVAFGGGTPLAKVPGKTVRKLDGLIPYAEPTEALRACFVCLDKRIESSVGIAAEQLERYFHAIDQNLPLDPWTDADFSGFQTQG